MSEGHFLKYPVLQQYLIKHPTNTIDLATSGSTAVVSQYISVVLEIIHRGTPIRCKVIVGIMKGLRYDLVLSLIVIASHYVDVLVDLLNVQLQQPSSNQTSSLSMMADHDATYLTELSPIHPQALANWKADKYLQQLYVPDPLFYMLVPNILQEYYSWSGSPENIQHKIDTTTRLLFEPEFQTIRTQDSEARVILQSLEQECNISQLPFITDDEALILLDQTASSNPTVAALLIPSHFPNSKLKLLNQIDLQKLLQHRFWQYHKSPGYNVDDSVQELRIFVMFVYHEYVDPNHYQRPTVLCEDLSRLLTDILQKLYTEVLNLLHMELLARNKLIPGPEFIVTETMNERLFIMVCRHFAYAGTINKILLFKDEFELLMAEIP
jgi:hypothetical protein